MDNYPWLDKPVADWTWEDVKAEMIRCGETGLDIARFVSVLCPDRDKHPEEFARREAIFNHCLEDQTVFNDYYDELYPGARAKALQNAGKSGDVFMG